MSKEKYSIRNKQDLSNIEDGRIVFTVLRDGVKDYSDYDDNLYKILTMNQLRPFRNNGRLNSISFRWCRPYLLFIRSSFGLLSGNSKTRYISEGFAAVL